MNEMEKAHILHKLKQGFDVSDEIFDTLLMQIKNAEYRDNFLRITKGLTIEDNYKLIIEALPWIKNVNGLDQNQTKEHKENYQVPDYSLLVENSDKKNFPILVDVKSVKDKKICSLMPKQINTLKNYSRDHKQELLIAIYWEKFGIWTHNVLKNFSGKKKNKITFEDALKNDLSHILSDYIFFIDKVFYRKTKFIKDGESKFYNHLEYGKFDEVYIGTDLNNLKKYEIMESSILDSMFIMKEIELIEEGNIVYQTEIFEGNSIVKLTTWLINFINLWKLKYHTKAYDDMSALKIARIFIVNLMHELGIQNIYLIPKDKNDSTLKIFELAYKDTYVMNNYLHK